MLRFKPGDLMIASFLLLISTQWIRDLSPQYWGQDTDHMMYFGQRLLTGEFHWTSEFDDKLPVVQMLFALPAAFDSMTVWISQSMAFILFGAASTYYVTTNILADVEELSETDVSKSAILAALAFITCVTFATGGIHHINPTASACTIGALALLMASCGQSGRAFRWVLFATSAALASIAIGIRPYFLISTVVAGFWIIYTRHIGSLLTLRLKSAILWGIFIGMWGIFINYVPYLILGETQAFWAGMNLLSQELNPESLNSTVRRILESLLGLTLPISIVMITGLGVAVFALTELITMRAIKQEPNSAPLPKQLMIDTAIVALGLPALLLLAILPKHFWPHYWQMFASYTSVGFGVFCALFYRTQIPPVFIRLTNAVCIGSLIIFVSPVTALNAWALSKAQPPPVEQQAIAVSRYIENLPAGSQDFLALGMMYIHWRLAEPRHGFPHAANSVHIINQGWWQNVAMPAWFNHPTTPAEYCAQIKAKGPSLIFIAQGTGKDAMVSFAQNCFGDDIIYARDTSFESDDLNLFRRR